MNPDSNSNTDLKKNFLSKPNPTGTGIPRILLIRGKTTQDLLNRKNVYCNGNKKNTFEIKKDNKYGIVRNLKKYYHNYLFWNAVESENRFSPYLRNSGCWVLNAAMLFSRVTCVAPPPAPSCIGCSCTG